MQTLNRSATQPRSGLVQSRTAAKHRAIAFSFPRNQKPSLRAVSVQAGNKLGDVSLFGDSTASLLGPSVSVEPKSKPQLDDVPLTSEVWHL